jgi:hypothetical protein
VNHKTWRQAAAPIIAKVLTETTGQSESAIRKALRDAFPWGERAMHPYKIWLDEIRRQRKKKNAAVQVGCQDLFGEES